MAGFRYEGCLAHVILRKGLVLNAYFFHTKKRRSCHHDTTRKP